MISDSTNNTRSIVARRAAEVIMEEGITDYLFAKKKDTEDIALNSRFQNDFALLDIFNPEAQSWLSNQLAAVKASGNVY